MFECPIEVFILFNHCKNAKWVAKYIIGNRSFNLGQKKVIDTTEKNHFYAMSH